MNKKQLPARPSLEHLKKQAKDLAREQKIALHEAQTLLARDYGFASWKKLHAHVESLLPQETLTALMGQLPAPVVEAIGRAAAGLAPFTGSVPALLPLVATRNALLTAGAVAPLHIGRPSSIAAIEAADGMLATFAQKDAANENPGARDLHPVGCAVEIVSFENNWLIVRAARWIRLDGIEQRDAYSLARVSELVIRDDGGDEVKRLHGELRARIDTLTDTLPGGAQLRKRTAKMSALELADATVANLPWPIDEKARYAETLELVGRLRFVLGLISPKG